MSRVQKSKIYIGVNKALVRELKQNAPKIAKAQEQKRIEEQKVKSMEIKY